MKDWAQDKNWTEEVDGLGGYRCVYCGFLALLHGTMMVHFAMRHPDIVKKNSEQDE